MNDSIVIRRFDCLEEFLRNQRLCWTAIDTVADLRVVGCVSIELVEDEWAWVNDLCVDAEYRRQGIAMRLVEEAEATARQIVGLLGMGCGVNRKNHASLWLFQSLGYRHVYTYPESSTLMLSKLFAHGAVCPL
jgi:GNAT superfamily N-acetyltransferase